MPRYDFRTPRLFVAPALNPDATIPLDRAQGNYLTNVLRLDSGDAVL
ncbi:MAG: 16S rRNA (uracil(1498)-N(3))-methyltransferase, partial [Pseudorhodoplanes sp.]